MKILYIFILFILICESRAENELNKFINIINQFPLYKEINLFNNSSVFHNSVIPVDSSPPKPPDNCDKISSQFLTALLGGKDWALAMFDPWGKIPIGMLEGNFVSLGNFDECLAIDRKIDTLNLTLKTQYCLGNIKGVTTNNPQMDAMLGGQIGLCFPKECTPEKIEQYIQQYINVINIFLKTNFKLPMSVSSCQTSDPLPLTTADIIAIVIFSLFGFLSILSTIYDLVVTPDKQNILLSSFSWYTNGKRILNTKENPNSIVCLHGVRFLSMCWVILGHRKAMNLGSPNTNRLTSLIEITEWKSVYFGAGNFSVDSFFLVGGLLVSYIAIKTLKKTNKMFNPLVYYLHRYLRLTPAFAIITLINAGLLIHFATGPLYPGIILTTELTYCQNYWWHNILYISNYFTTTPCVAQGWYLGVDMQLYILSPILLFIFWKKPLFGYITSLVLLVGSFVIQFVLTYQYNMTGGILESMDPINIYYPTYARYAPYVIGMALGYKLIIDRERKYQMNKVVLLIIWTLDIALLIGLVLSNHTFFQILDPPVSLLERSFYNALHRTAWSLALSWVIYACAIGQGGFINTFLSWKGFIPFSKISYSMYLLHMDVIYVFGLSLRTVPGYSDFITIPNIVSDIMISSFFALIFSLLFESPIINIEKLIFQGKRNNGSPSKDKVQNTMTQNP